MKKGYSCAALKYIAAVCMLCDHIGMILFEHINFPFGDMLDVLFRSVGRWAFPLFLFCLIQGYFHTHDKKLYAKRLFVAAILVEIPYDLGTTGHFFVWNQNNVMWTMWLIIIMCLLYDKARLQKEKDVRFCYCGIIWAGCSLLAYVCHVEYGFAAITAATALYVYYNRPLFGYGLSLVSLSVLFSPIEALALPSAFFISRYDHTKGKQSKYFFYLFYPLHLVLLRLLYLCFLYL